MGGTCSTHGELKSAYTLGTGTGKGKVINNAGLYRS